MRERCTFDLWGQLYDIVSERAFQEGFNSLNREELNLCMREHRHEIVSELRKFSELLKPGEDTDRAETYLKLLSKTRCFALLIYLGRSLRCWMETGLGDRPVSHWVVSHD